VRHTRSFCGILPTARGERRASGYWLCWEAWSWYPPVPALTIDAVSSDQGPVLLRVGGELDWGTTEALQSTIERLLAEGRSIVLDVRRLEFMDSSGLSALLKAKHRASMLMIDFRVAGHHGPAADLMARTGTLPFLTGPSRLPAGAE
jgi:anti-sigma B factor antagonist